MIKAQLSNDSDVPASVFINDDLYVAEQKINGQRLLIKQEDNKLSVYNRHGEEMTIQKGCPLYNFFQDTPAKHELLFDGEYLNGKFYLFDAITCGGIPLQALSYDDRRDFLEGWYEAQDTDVVQLLPVARTTEEKKWLHDYTKIRNLEGLVFKNRKKAYLQGDKKAWIKCKHYNTVDAFILEMFRGGKAQAVTLGLYVDGGGQTEIGGCKLPVHIMEQVDIGSVLEIRYLHATEARQLNIPTFSHVRLDKPAEACYTSQLQYENKEIIKDFNDH